MHINRNNTLLGKNIAIPQKYSPEILQSLPRPLIDKEKKLNTIFGYDIWHAYEVSWLNEISEPIIAIAIIKYSSQSAMIIESKSLKLYLNSLNNTKFHNYEEISLIITRDLTDAIKTKVEVSIYELNDWIANWQYTKTNGICIDKILPISHDHDTILEQSHIYTFKNRKNFLYVMHQKTNTIERVQKIYSNIFRTKCPITSQPDWATIEIEYCGKELNNYLFKKYLICFREHEAFHEECIDQIYHDLHRILNINNAMEHRYLIIHGFYTRRGGISLSCYRSSKESITTTKYTKHDPILDRHLPRQ